MSTRRRQQLRDADCKREAPLFFQQSVKASNLMIEALKSLFPRNSRGKASASVPGDPGDRQALSETWEMPIL